MKRATFGFIREENNLIESWSLMKWTDHTTEFFYSVALKLVFNKHGKKGHNFHRKCNSFVGQGLDPTICLSRTL